jgi:hypothetical protein
VLSLPQQGRLALAERDYAEDIDEDEHDREHHDDGPAHGQNPPYIADHVGIFLCRSSGQQTLATRPSGPCYFRGATSIAAARPVDLGGVFLSYDLRLELGGSGFIGCRQTAGLRFGTCLGSGGTVPLGMSLARSVRSTSALGHGL